MVLEKEIGLIRNDEIRGATAKLIEKYEVKIKEQPTSLSGKYHMDDPVVELHLQRAVWIAHELCREFKIEGEDQDIIIAATLLHDVGNYKHSHKGYVPGCSKFFAATGWCRMTNLNNHPIESAEVIEAEPFRRYQDVSRLAKCHMSHWYKNCPQPGKLDEYIVCVADYLASREGLKINLSNF